tara:strand:+ start:783 stop:1226 length:444 start_codon:yes stop_codon:yes gene_type:complete
MSNGEIYCYIDLAETNYTIDLDYQILQDPDTDLLLDIYRQYAIYKKLNSVWPMFAEQFTNPYNDTIGYFDQGNLVAWSLISKSLGPTAIEAVQFAWDYKNPKLKLGYKTMRNECAMYKAQGYEILILGDAHEYKKQIQGFKLFGPAI